MISYYKTIQNRLIACNAPEAGCWVSVIDPTAQERKMLIEIQKNDTIVFYTMPMSIIIKDQLVFTISLRDNKVLEDMVDGRLRNVQTSFRTQFVLRLIMQLTSTYLVYLKQIDKASNALERELHKAVKNKQLLQMMELENSAW